MGIKDVLGRKSGVIVAKDVYDLFKLAQKENCMQSNHLLLVPSLLTRPSLVAIPAINVTNSSTVVAGAFPHRHKNTKLMRYPSTGICTR